MARVSMTGTLNAQTLNADTTADELPQTVNHSPYERFQKLSISHVN